MMSEREAWGMAAEALDVFADEEDHLAMTAEHEDRIVEHRIRESAYRDAARLFLKWASR
jgi:hypothetical protein